MNGKILVPALLFSVVVLTVNAQVNEKGTSPAVATGSQQVKSQAGPEQTKKAPEKKKKKCWFSRKKKKNDAPKPAAKDQLKDRNTRDPRIDNTIKPAMKADSSVLKKL